MEDIAIDDVLESWVSAADPNTLARVLNSAIRVATLRQRFASRLRDEVITPV